MVSALELESLYEPKPLAMFAAGYVNTSIFYFFYKKYWEYAVVDITTVFV